MLSSDDLRFFAAVAAARTLAATARALDVTPSAVTQRLRQLETRVGVRLVHRTGRALTLTDEGTLLAARGGPLVAELDALTEALGARGDTVAGHLRVVAPPGFGRVHVAPTVARFHADHPGVTVELTLTDRVAPALADGCDVAVHVGALPDSPYLVRRLAPNARVVCAAPDYLARHPAPTHPAALVEHACLVARENDEDVTLWRFRRAAVDAADVAEHSGDAGDAEVVSVRVRPAMATNDGEVLRAWALAGYGVTVRSEWSVADDLRAGRLVRLLPEFVLAPADVVALMPPGRGRAARTRRFVDHLARAFSPAPWRILSTARPEGRGA